MRSRRRRGDLDLRWDEAPLTPMIDVLFQLLAFFVLAAPFPDAEAKLLMQLPDAHG